MKLRSTSAITTYDVESGGTLTIDWRTRRVEFTPTEMEPDTQKPALDLGSVVAALMPPEPELDLEPSHADRVAEAHASGADAYTLDGWQYAAVLVPSQLRSGSQMGDVAYRAGEQYKTTGQPVCYASLDIDIKESMRSGILAQLFDRGHLARRKYHCGCAGVANPPKRIVYHYRPVAPVAPVAPV